MFCTTKRLGTIATSCLFIFEVYGLWAIRGKELLDVGRDLVDHPTLSCIWSIGEMVPQIGFERHLFSNTPDYWRRYGLQY